NRGERQRIFGWKPAGVVYVGRQPDSIWARALERAAPPQVRDPIRPAGVPIQMAIREGTLTPLLSKLRADLAAAQASTVFQVRPLGDALLHVHARLRIAAKSSAPNGVAILAGS